ncbi:MAG TPA: four helix bundle protein [Polyangiaceae bacterium]|jgi:four helix bundle protein
MALHIYDFTIETIRLFAPVLREIEKRDRSLADQMRRALASIALNQSEGAGSRGGNRRLRYENACGSAKESRAAYDVAIALGYVTLDEVLADRVERIVATMYRLGRPAP